MSSTASDKAVAWLEHQFENDPRRFIAQKYMFSIKVDGFPSCTGGVACQRHVGEAMYAHAPRLEHYGHGWYEDEYGGKLPKYGIDLIDDHWKAPCP